MEVGFQILTAVDSYAGDVGLLASRQFPHLGVAPFLNSIPSVLDYRMLFSNQHIPFRD